MTTGLSRAVQYRAIYARDKKYDGIFYYGKKATKVYCRPSCIAPPPLKEDYAFFNTTTAAKLHGFQACETCQPDRLENDLFSKILTSIDAGVINDQGVHGLADSLHISERHLRRLMQDMTGTSPLRFNREKRLAAAKVLIIGSNLPVIDVAFIAGFPVSDSSTMFYKEAFNVSPRETRKAKNNKAEKITL